MEGSNGTPAKGRGGVMGGLGELDRILRGELTQVSSLQRGGIDISPRRLSLVIVILGMVYGICMGTYALFRMKGPHAWQIVASMVKVPLLVLFDALGHVTVSLCIQRSGRIAADFGVRSCVCWSLRWG